MRFSSAETYLKSLYNEELGVRSGREFEPPEWELHYEEKWEIHCVGSSRAMAKVTIEGVELHVLAFCQCTTELKPFYAVAHWIPFLWPILLMDLQFDKMTRPRLQMGLGPERLSLIESRAQFETLLEQGKEWKRRYDI